MKKNSLIIAFFLFVLFIIGGGIFILLNRESTGTAVSVSSVVPENENTAVIIEEEEEVGAEQYLLPEGWATYSNADLKFTINYPIKAYNPSGGCTQVTENGMTSYRPTIEEVPVKIFEGVDSVYIDFEYYRVLGNPTEVDGVSYFATCTKNERSLMQLQLSSERKTWHIITKKTESVEELKNFIKDRFGSGCEMGSMKATVENNKVYDVTVKGDGLDLSETKCPINYMFVLKYVPSTGYIYTYDLGQAYTFAKNAAGTESYDQEMNLSFQPIL